MRASLNEIGELEMIERIQRMLPARPDIIRGAGDDCAIVRLANSERDLVLTSDPVIQGTHFAADTPAAQIGHKGIGRALSDLAAMGADPAWALINVVAPESAQAEHVEAVYAGAVATATHYGLAIAGGDVAAGPTLELHVFAIGDLPHGTACLRSTAQDGDILYVTGSLGGSAGGRHLEFTPRVHEGRFLREWATAMIDVSDGIATDLTHLARASGTGAHVELERLPISEAANAISDDRSPLEHALYDGEDFELLFTVSSTRADAFAEAWTNSFDLPCTRIGTITDRTDGVAYRTADGAVKQFTGGGYEHFRA